MRYLLILIRSAASITKLSFLYLRYRSLKRSAVRHFEDELTTVGLPPDSVHVLTKRYAEMLPLNPKEYKTRSTTRKRV